MELTREEVASRLAAVGYIADPQLAMAITRMRTLGRPLLLEGEAGVGKTEVGKALAAHARPAADPPAVLRRTGRECRRR